MPKINPGVILNEPVSMKNISYLRIFLGEFKKDIVTTINTTIDYVLFSRYELI